MRSAGRGPEYPPVISRSAEYAIRALAYLAQAGDRWALNREIAEELDLPPQFLTKLLGTLAREGLLGSQRGRSGGFRLARAPREIRLIEIVDPFDRLSGRQQCLLGQDVCSDRYACPLHETWKGIQEEFRSLFGRTTLADVIESAPRGAFPKSGSPVARSRRILPVAKKAEKKAATKAAKTARPSRA